MTRQGHFWVPSEHHTVHLGFLLHRFGFVKGFESVFSSIEHTNLLTELFL